MAYFTHPGHQSNMPTFGQFFFFETRLSYVSLEPLIVFLAYLDKKLCHKKTKSGQNIYPYKKKPGLNNTPFVCGHNSPLE